MILGIRDSGFIFMLIQGSSQSRVAAATPAIVSIFQLLGRRKGVKNNMLSF